MAVNGARYRTIARHIDERGGRCGVERHDLIIADDAVVNALRSERIDIGGAGQPDRFRAVGALLEREAEPDRGFARCAGDQYLLDAIIALILELVGDQPAGEEERAEHRPIIMVGGAIVGQRLDPLIIVIDGGQGGAARRHIGEAARSRLADRQHGVACHRIIAIETVTDRDALGAAFGHRRKTPDGQAAGFAGLGKEIPITLIIAEQPCGLSEYGIGNVVRGHRIAVEMDTDLTRRERRARFLNQLNLRDIIAINVDRPALCAHSGPLRWTCPRLRDDR